MVGRRERKVGRDMDGLIRWVGMHTAARGFRS